MKPSFLATFTCCMLAATVSTRAESSPPARPSRESVLRHLAQKVIEPAYRELADRCRTLGNAATALHDSPSAATLEQARAAWTDAMTAARQVQCFLSGPMADRDGSPLFFYSQTLPARVDTVIRSTQPIDAAAIEELGAPVRGMFALEYLLFGQRRAVPSGPRQEAAAILESLSDSTRRREMIRALARDVQAKAELLAQDWAAPGTDGATARFIAGGQESINQLVNQLAHTTEAIAENRLHAVLQLPHPVHRQFHRIEGSPSGTSQSSAREILAAVHRWYEGSGGPGLDDLIAPLNAGLDQRLQAHFQSALSSVEALNGPLEEVVVASPASLTNAYEKARELEVLFKVDVASTLGVTLTFSSNDGD